MKRIANLILLAMLTTICIAQSPNAFQFQAVARDASGNELLNQTIGVQFDLHQGSAAGPVVFSEEHSALTNGHGLFSLQVGTGNVSVGPLSATDWSTGPYFLETSIDPNGGTSYTSMGTQQLVSVPYALYANSTQCFNVSFQGDTLHQGNGCFVIIPGISAANGGCADADGDGYFAQAGCGTPVDCDDNDPNFNPGANDDNCNGLDENCDGNYDENFVSGTPCNTGLPGLCGNGILVCQNGSLTCQSTYQPQPEVCNGLDDNCDGQIDEGNPGGGGACNTGLPGLCSAGILVCQNGSLTCQSTYQPQPEVCNGLDDDCDGQVDEDFNLTSDVNNCGACGNACPPGFTCQAGSCVSICPPAGTPCEDGNLCTLNDQEDGNCNCISGPPKDCDDANPCTQDACNPATGQCIFTPVACCSDGIMNGQETDIDCGGPDCQPCQTGDNCLQGTDCPPGSDCCANICTDVQNDPNNCGACGNACPPGFTCQGGTCI